MTSIKTATDGASLLPAWFTERMMGDDWFFALLLVTGDTMMIRCITAITKDAVGNLWLDVEMIESEINEHWGPGIAPAARIMAPTSRTKASVRADSIVAAYELADTVGGSNDEQK